MIHLKINKKRGTIATNWQDITINQAIRLMAIELPDTLKDDPTDTALWYVGTDGYKYAAQVFEVLSTFDREDIQHTNAADIMLYFIRHHLQKVIDLHSTTPSSYEQTFIQSFEFEGKRYLLPKSLKVESQTMPMYSSKAIDFVESSNILSVIADLGKDGIKHLPLFVAIYCRDDADKYDEQAINDLAKKFNNLPMSVALEVFFCIQQLMLSYASNTLRYTAKQLQRYRMQLRVQGWIAGVTQLGFIRWRSRGARAQLTQLN